VFVDCILCYVKLYVCKPVIDGLCHLYTQCCQIFMLGDSVVAVTEMSPPPQWLATAELTSRPRWRTVFLVDFPGTVLPLSLDGSLLSH